MPASSRRTSSFPSAHTLSRCVLSTAHRGRFFRSRRLHFVTYKIGVIPGDGIGPEIVGARPWRCCGPPASTSTSVALRPRRRPLPPRRPRARRRRPRRPSAAATPSSRARSAAHRRHPRSPAGTIERGIILAAPLRPRPVHQPAPVRRQRASTSSSSGRTPRAPTPARAGSSARARPHEIATQGSVNTRIGVERCVRYAFELAMTRPAPPPHAGAQDQRADLRRRPVAADVRRGGRRVPRRRRPPTTTSTPPASTSSRTRSATT